MNKKAVKQLTKKGCIVAKEAAESLTDEDIERIESLDSPPMYITEDMLENIRDGSQEDLEPEEPGQAGEVEGIEEAETGKQEDNSSEDEEAEAADDTESSSPGTGSTTVLRDTGRRELRTKVEVLDEADISREEKDVPEFLAYYNDRYDRAKKMLTRRMEMKSAVTIQRLKRKDEGDEATTLGLVKDKYSTSSGRYIVELEDKTGTFKVLAGEREGERIVPDEVIGVRGSMGGDIIYADSIVRPDIPIPDGVNTTEQKVRAAYISDFHFGSIDTMEGKLDRFAEWLGTRDARNIGYLVIPGDVVEGVGNYPGQEDELKVTDIYSQYAMFEEWLEKVPERVEVIVGPGNHDITRLAEPQPRIPEKALPDASDFNNVHLVQNPQCVRLHGIESEGILNLMYHGYSFDGHIDQIQALRERGYEEPHHVMIDLLKRRHLAPTFGSNLLAPGDHDTMMIDRKPDVFVAGHLHSHSSESYKGVSIIASSTFQAQTDFQKRVGHEPDPGKVTVVDYRTRNTEVKQF